jgi:hypothetical protein
MIFRKKTNFNQLVRSDKSIRSDIWTALWEKRTIRSIDLNSISVSVKDGVVHLDGHVARDQNRQSIETISQSVPGVISIRNSIIADRDLTIKVAQALAEDDYTRPHILWVGCWHGWISISGEIPTPRAQLATEAAASQVPFVRGVISLPSVKGETASLTRSIVQPTIGSHVYGKQGKLGLVTGVVISPCDRLVSHVVVSANYEVDGWPIFGEYILPAESIEQLNRESIFLARDSLSLSAYPVFDPMEYPTASSKWQPPYPYASGTVRWSIEGLPGHCGTQ